MTKVGYKGRITESEGFVNCPYIPKSELFAKGKPWPTFEVTEIDVEAARKTEQDILEALSVEICKAIDEEVIKEMSGEKRSEMPNWLTPGVTVREVDITEYIPAASNTHGLILKKTEQFSNMEFTYSNPPLDIEAELARILREEIAREFAACERLERPNFGTPITEIFECVVPAEEAKGSKVESLPEINESKIDDFKLPDWLQKTGNVHGHSLRPALEFEDPQSRLC